MQLQEVLSRQDEADYQNCLRNYQLEKAACLHDSGPRCAHCKRKGTPACFDEEKAEKAWQWW